MHPCRSAHRRNQTTCATCAWRHARKVSCRVVQGWGGPYYAVRWAHPAPTPLQSLRVEIRNRIDYLRRRSPWWRSFGWVLYQTRDGGLRGVATLGTLGALEVVEAFHARWPTTLRLIRAEDLRQEVWRCMRPAVMPPTLTGRGGYQALRLSIWASRSVVRTLVLSSYPPEFVAPMPVLL